MPEPQTGVKEEFKQKNKEKMNSFTLYFQPKQAAAEEKLEEVWLSPGVSVLLGWEETVDVIKEKSSWSQMGQKWQDVKNSNRSIKRRNKEGGHKCFTNSHHFKRWHEKQIFKRSSCAWTQVNWERAGDGQKQSHESLFSCRIDHVCSWITSPSAAAPESRQEDRPVQQSADHIKHSHLQVSPLICYLPT